MPVPIPCGTHDAAREVQLDVIDSVLDLLADRFDKAIRAVALQRVTGGEEVASGCSEKVTARVDARADKLARVESALPRHVHVMVCAGTAEADDAGFGQRRHQPMPE